MAYKIDEVVDFDSLTCVAHAMAVEKGWWDDGINARPIEDIVNNFHAEVSEAWEEYRAGRMSTWYADPQAVLAGKLPKPEGFFVELADLLIRIADAAGAHRIEFPDEPITQPVFDNMSRNVLLLHGTIDKFLFATAAGDCFGIAKANNHDLWATIREKLAYNATRPYRHGEKKA